MVKIDDHTIAVTDEMGTVSTFYEDALLKLLLILIVEVVQISLHDWNNSRIFQMLFRASQLCEQLRIVKRQEVATNCVGDG